MATRCAPSRRAAWAATAALLIRQKPIAAAGAAWWPGGRTSANALQARPVQTSSTATTAAPAARAAACQLPGEAGVSGSSSAYRPSSAARMSTCTALCTAISASRVAGRGSAQIVPSTGSRRRSRTMRRNRSAVSGCPGPVSCSKKAGSVSNSVGAVIGQGLPFLGGALGIAFLGLGHVGEVEREAGPAAVGIRNVDRAAVIGDNLAHDRQSQPGALLARGEEEGEEQHAQDRENAGAVVLDVNADAGAVAR